MDHYIQIKKDTQILAVANEVHRILQFHIERERKLIKLLYKSGFTQDQIGESLGVGKAAISLQYPREKLMKEEETKNV